MLQYVLNEIRVDSKKVHAGLSLALGSILQQPPSEFDLM